LSKREGEFKSEGKEERKRGARNDLVVFLAARGYLKEGLTYYSQ